MSILSTTLTPIISNKNSVFFSPPNKLKIDEEGKTKASTQQKVDVLMEELKEKGPHVAFGWLGPKHYKDDPFKLKDRYADREIYGWKPNASRKEKEEKCYAIVLGARKVEEKGYVYFTMSMDATLNTTSYIREQRQTDSRIFVASEQTFFKSLFDLYPPEEKSKLNDTYGNFSLSDKCENMPVDELAYVKKLCNLEFDSILDGGIGEEACKKMGQEIFDVFKKKANGSSEQGFAAAQRICDAVRHCAPNDGSLRKQYIEYAWDGIGDEKKRWER